MKSLFLVTALAAAATEAHYIFNILIVNGVQQGGEYTYVRKNSNQYNPPSMPGFVTSNDLRCNVGARAGGNVKTYQVNAGDKLGFKVFNREVIEHPGPGFVYMSKAPDGGLDTYDGSGDWFKAYEVGLCKGNAGSDGNWCTFYKDKMEFTVPAKTPPGDYLVRVEHIGLHGAQNGDAQFYVECYQLSINGTGGGTPGPLVKIPGIYRANDPGIRYNKWSSNPAPYVMPGPQLWDGN
jgi:hypothetical protein